MRSEMELFAAQSSPSIVAPRSASRRCPSRLPTAKACFAIIALCGLSAFLCGVDGYSLREVKNGLREMSFMEPAPGPGKKWSKSRDRRAAIRRRSPSPPPPPVFTLKYQKAVKGGQPTQEEKTCEKVIRAEVKKGGTVDCTLDGKPCVSKDLQHFDDNAEFAYNDVRGGSLKITTSGPKKKIREELSGRDFHLTMTSKGAIGIEVMCDSESPDDKEVSVGPVTIEASEVKKIQFQHKAIPLRS